MPTFDDSTGLYRSHVFTLLCEYEKKVKDSNLEGLVHGFRVLGNNLSMGLKKATRFTI